MLVIGSFYLIITGLTGHAYMSHYWAWTIDVFYLPDSRSS